MCSGCVCYARPPGLHWVKTTTWFRSILNTTKQANQAPENCQPYGAYQIFLPPAFTEEVFFSVASVWLSVCPSAPPQGHLYTIVTMEWERRPTDGRTDGWTDRRTLQSTLSPCFAKLRGNNQLRRFARPNVWYKTLSSTTIQPIDSPMLPASSTWGRKQFNLTILSLNITNNICGNLGCIFLIILNNCSSFESRFLPLVNYSTLLIKTGNITHRIITRTHKIILRGTWHRGLETVAWSIFLIWIASLMTTPMKDGKLIRKIWKIQIIQKKYEKKRGKYG